MSIIMKIMQTELVVVFTIALLGILTVEHDLLQVILKVSMAIVGVLLVITAIAAIWVTQ